jgi:hypothetical protein
MDPLVVKQNMGVDGQMYKEVKKMSQELKAWAEKWQDLSKKTRKWSTLMKTSNDPLLIQLRAGEMFFFFFFLFSCVVRSAEAVCSAIPARSVVEGRL